MKLFGLEIRRIRAQADLKYPSQELITALRGSQLSSAGVNVTPENALGLADVFACVRVLAEDIAALPLHLMALDGQGSRRRATEHYLYELVHDAPNPEMSSYTFRVAMVANQALRGNAYAEIERDAAGRVVALWPIPAKMVSPMRNRNRVGQGVDVILPGVDPEALIYVVNLPGGEQRVLTADRMLHVPALSFDGIVGKSPVEVARETVGLSLAAEQYGAKFFAEGAHVDDVLKHPGRLSEEAARRLRESWSAQHQGLDRAHRTAILEEGMDYARIGLAPAESQFIEVRRFNTPQIAKLFRMPPHKIMDLSEQKWANVEQMALEYVTGTLLPWLVQWEQELKRRLLRPSERSRYYFKFNVDGLLRGDIQSRYRAYSIGRQWGWLSADDIRELEDMNPLPDGQGSIYLVPLNMIPANRAGEGEPGPGTGEAVRAAIRPLVADAADRVARRAQADLGRLPAGVMTEEYFRGEHRQWVARTLAPLAALASRPDVHERIAERWSALCSGRSELPDAAALVAIIEEELDHE